MTSQAKCINSRLGGARGILISTVLTAAVFMAAIYLSDELGGYVEDALLLSVKIIIPSLFPFLILTDLIMPHLRFDIFPPAGRIFERVFKINGGAISVFICGIVCGFPIGAKLAYDAYRRGAISRDECERLMAFSNNAGPSYVISAVGASVRGSVSDGIIIYLSMVASSILTGMIIGAKSKKSELFELNLEQKYSFIDSIKNAARISINVTAFICTFGIFVGLTKTVIKNEVLRAVSISLLEIGNAAVYLAGSSDLPRLFTLTLTSFSISFSGLSVILQTLSIQEKESVANAKLYVSRKLMQGVISSVITVIIYLILS